jgi:hypothetical protein
MREFQKWRARRIGRHYPDFPARKPGRFTSPLADLAEQLFVTTNQGSHFTSWLFPCGIR